MTTIRRRLTFWYTVALGVTVLAFGTAALPRAAAVQPAGAGPAAAARGRSGRPLAQRVATTCWGGSSPRPASRPALDPGISAYLEAVRDYLVVADTGGQVLALSDVARALGADDLAARSPPLLDTLRTAQARRDRATSRPAVGQVALPGHPGGATRARGRRRAGRHLDRARSRSGPRELLRSMLLIAPGRSCVGRGARGLLARRDQPPAGAGHHGRGGGDHRRPEPPPPARRAALRRRDGAARPHGERHARPAGAELRQPAPLHGRREPRAQDPAHGAPGRRGARAGASRACRPRSSSRSTRRWRRSTR